MIVGWNTAENANVVGGKELGEGGGGVQEDIITSFTVSGALQFGGKGAPSMLLQQQEAIDYAYDSASEMDDDEDDDFDISNDDWDKNLLDNEEATKAISKVVNLKTSFFCNDVWN